MKVSTEILERYRGTASEEALQIIVFEIMDIAFGIDTHQNR